MKKTPDSTSDSLGNVPEDFLRQARQNILDDRSNALVPIMARSGEGLFEAAAIVARSLGIELKRARVLTEEGKEQGALDAILRQAELRRRPIVLPPDWYQGDSGPLLGFLSDSGRPVALVPRKSSVYRLVDPVEGTSKDVDQSLAGKLSEKAVMFYRPFPDGPLNARQVFYYALRGRSHDLWLILIVGVLAALLGLAVPLATEFVVNQVIPGAQRGQLLEIGLGLVIVALAMTLFHLTSAFAMLRIEGRGDHDVQTAVWCRVLQLNTHFFRRFSAGDLANRVDGINTIRHALSSAVVGYMLGAVFSLLNLGLIFYYSWKLALVAVALVGIAGLSELLFSWLELQYVRPGLDLAGRITGRVFQILNGIVKWKVAAAEERALEQWSFLFLQKKRLDKTAGNIRAFASAFRAFFPIFATLVNFAVFYFFLGSTLNVGQFMAYNSAFGQMLSAILGAASATITLVNCLPVYERLRPIITADVERDSTGADPGRLGGRIDVVDLRFRYANDQPAVLDGLSFSAEPGEFVAIVGSTGCGKSTLVRLLLGFESPE
ncbi:MAG: ABC transporter transmembrane domain-containing protein, partial [Spartobacteria bacterium]